MYPPCLDFEIAFWSCVLRGIIAVPVIPPNPNDLERSLVTIHHIAQNCDARFALTIKKVKMGLKLSFKSVKIPLVSTDEKKKKLTKFSPFEEFSENDLVFLQYTSGSTSLPKGVMVSNKNILHNASIMVEKGKLSKDGISLCWVPHFHDMGLIGARILPLYFEYKSILMSPLSFIKNPKIWMKAVSDFKATYIAAPNFAYESKFKILFFVF